MKKLIYTITFLLSISINAQQIQWEKTFGGMHADYLYDAMPTLDYGFIMVGGSLSNNTGDVGNSEGDYDYFITKVSEYGELEWTTTLGGEKSDIIKNITNTYDGGYLVSGISNSSNSNNKATTNIGMQDVWLVKISIEGDIEWQKSLGGLANEDVLDVIKTKDGYYIAGTSASSGAYYEKPLTDNAKLILKKDTNQGNLDYWLVKIDLNGQLLWQKSFGGYYKDVLNKVIELPNGEILLAGSSNSPMSGSKNTKNYGFTDWWLLKLKNTGQVVWQKSFGDTGDDQLRSLILTKDNNIIIGGHFRDEDDKDADFVLKKINSEGHLIWEESYSQGVNDILTDVIENKDGTLLLSGYSGKSKQNKGKVRTDDYLVIKIDAEGEEMWRKNIGSKDKEVLQKCIETRDGGYVLMGSVIPSIPTAKSSVSFYIVKLKDNDKITPDKLPLEAIPNPTANYTQIVLGKTYHSGEVLVSDYTGHVLQRFKINGSRIVPVNLSAYSTGAYIISIETDTEKNSAKVLKIE